VLYIQVKTVHLGLHWLFISICIMYYVIDIISASLAIKAEQSAYVIEMSSTRVCPHM